MSSDNTLIRRFRLVPAIVLGAGFWLPVPAACEEQSMQQMLQSEIIEPVDISRDYLSEKFVGLAGYVDHFFGDDRNYQESNRSVLQLDLTRAIGRGAERRFILSGKAKLHLPNVEKHLHLVIETNPEQSFTGEQPQPQAVPGPQSTTPESFAAAARFENAVEQRAYYSADAGIQFQGADTSPFIRGRGRYTLSVDDWLFKPVETLFWYKSTGTGTNTQLDMERRLSESMMFRASTNATWLMKTGSFDLRQDLSVYHTLDERTALRYQASAIGVSQPKLQVTEYILLLLYRYRLHHEWVYAELSPQLHFSQSFNYRITPMLVLRLEVLFDDPH